MNKILINGIIGIDITFNDIYQQLSNFKGDIEIIINSAGGLVYDGIAIYNAIKNYNKGKKRVRICGLSASMASYIMLAGDILELEENSVIMIHNPSTFINGDYREFKKITAVITKLRDLISFAYSTHLNKSLTEIHEMMDNETYFIGKQDLSIWGKVIETSNSLNITKETAEIEIKTMTSLIKNEASELVALLNTEPLEKNNFNNNFNNNIVINMNDLNDFKNQYPNLYIQAINLGVNQEKSRIQAHLEFLDINKTDVLQAINNNIDFASNSEIQAKYLKAKINNISIKQMEQDSNPSIIQAQIDENKEITNSLNKNKNIEEQIKAYMPRINNIIKE